MIRRLQLRNWRAYTDLTLELDPGTTFVVAKNGVGKTSIVSGLAWTLFDQPLTEVKSSLHFGEPADGWAELELADGRVLTVHRQFDGTRRTLEASVTGTALAPDEYEAFLRDALGAPTGLLSRTTVLGEGDARPEAAEELHLQDHLCRVFGVDGLRELSEELAKRTKQNRAATAQVRSAARLSEGQLAGFHAEHERLAAEVNLAKAEVEQLRARYNDVRRQLTEAESAAKFTALAATRVEQLRQIAVEIGKVTGIAVDPSNLDGTLESAERRLAAEAEPAQRRRAELDARARYIRTGLVSLNETGQGSCPVCRRPLRDQDVAEARSGHETELAEIAAELAELDNAVISERREVLRAIRRRLNSVPAVPVVPESELSVDAAEERETEVQTALQDAVGRLRVLEAQLAETATREENSKSGLAAAAGATRRFRYEALLTAAQIATDEVVKKTLETQIDPLTLAVRERWKLLFGHRGDLHLGPDGSLCRIVNGKRLPFAQFSAGERTAALLILRMLVVAASTTAGFIWVDEPLEHLDPDGRRRVASMLARATTPTGLRQVLVTTYEEPLARRLAERVEGVHLRYVRAT